MSTKDINEDEFLNEGAPLFPQDNPPEPEPEGGTVVLVLSGPFYTSSFTTQDAEGVTLVIDRQGTEVPSSAADDLIQSAATSGVVLSKVSN